MLRALALSAVVAALAAATLAPKYLAASVRAEADERRLARDMAAMLRRLGYRARPVRHHLYAPVAATRGRCRLLAANASSSGYLRARFGRLAAPIGAVRYRYGDKESADFPRVTPVLADYAQRWLHPFGISLDRTPIIAIAASPGCAGAPAAWGSLRLWPVTASRSAPARS